MVRPVSSSTALGVAALGIAIYSVMDVLLKRLSIESGAVLAVLWRSWAGVAITGAAMLARRERWPDRAAIRLHAVRGVLATVSVLLFFWGLVRVPMAQGVAITFVAPLLAIFLAAWTLGEPVRRAALIGSGVAAAGVLVIAAGQSRAHASAGTLLGTAAIFAASLLYAGSLVMLRRQAQVAPPLEIAFFNTLVMAVACLPVVLFLPALPTLAQMPPVIGAAVLGTVSGMLLTWAYARAQAQVLAPVEYSAFIWAAMLGWLVFGERVSAWTVAGATLIIAGCVAAVRGASPAMPPGEAAAG